MFDAGNFIMCSVIFVLQQQERLPVLF